MHIHEHAAIYKNIHVGECNIHMHTFMPIHGCAHILYTETHCVEEVSCYH